MKKQKGLGLIGVLIIIGALVITVGGVVVWGKKTLPTPKPTPTLQTQPTTPPRESTDQCLGLNEEDCLAKPRLSPHLRSQLSGLYG